MMDADAINELISAMQMPEIHDMGADHKFVTLPKGTTFHSLKDLMPPPDRVKQKVTLLTVLSFVEYVNRFKATDSTIFANEVTGQYEATLDYHSANDKRGTSDHVAAYLCPKSEQWKAWTEKDKVWFGQQEFAEFLESNLKEIHSPPGAQFLEVALQLQVHKAAEFASDVRLDNGQVKFRYDETVRGTARNGDIEIPASFVLKMPVVVDGAVFQIEARFRYRMTEGKLTLGYELIRPKEVWQAAIKQVTDEVRKGATSVHLYAGARG
jgi:uncharacterized protein YfdQ (DUF2303 family)